MTETQKMVEARENPEILTVSADMMRQFFTKLAANATDHNQRMSFHDLADTFSRGIHLAQEHFDPATNELKNLKPGDPADILSILHQTLTGPFMNLELSNETNTTPTEGVVASTALDNMHAPNRIVRQRQSQ